MRYLLNECPEKFNQVSIVVVNAKVETIKQRKRIVIYVVTMLAKNIYNFLVEFVLPSLLLFHQPVGFLECIESLVMKVDLLFKLVDVVFTDLFILFI